jgi:5-methylcytosine-specific restriction endonuclease McrA
LTRDHVVPQALGGSNCIENIQILCVACNQAKADRIIIYTPRKRVRRYVNQWMRKAA